MKKPPRKRKPFSRPPRKVLPKELPAELPVDQPPVDPSPQAATSPDMGWSWQGDQLRRRPGAAIQNEPAWMPQPPPAPIPSGWMNMDDGSQAIQAINATRS